jgi:hypothetical protein
MTTWDEGKREENVRKHGVDLADAEYFEWDDALTEEDLTQNNYGEQRFRAIGPINNDLYVYIFTENEDETDHAISLRKALKKERRYYVDKIEE